MKTKYWIAGHSRGAAVANLAAAEIIRGNGLSADEDDVYAFCFACPSMQADGVLTTSAIRNFNNTTDLVPLLPLEEWGFKRNGVTYELCSNPDSARLLQSVCLSSLSYLMPTRSIYDQAWNAAVRKGAPKAALVADSDVPIVPLLVCAIGEIGTTLENEYTELSAVEQLVISESIVQFFGIWLVHDGSDAHTMATTYIDLMEEHETFGQQALQIRSDLRSQ